MAVKKCSSPPDLINAIGDSTDLTIGSAFVYTCSTGHQFPEGSHVRSFVCMDNQQWHTEFADCEGIAITVFDLNCFYGNALNKN